MQIVIDVLAVIGALWIVLSVFFAFSDTIKGNQIERIMRGSTIDDIDAALTQTEVP